MRHLIQSLWNNATDRVLRLAITVGIALLCLIFAWMYLALENGQRQMLSVVQGIRMARIDLAHGLLSLSVAGNKAPSFGSEPGDQLLERALAALTREFVSTALANSESPLVQQLGQEISKAAIELRQRLDEWRAAPKGEAQSIILQKAYSQLERLSAAADVALEVRLLEFRERESMLFWWLFGFGLLVLVLILSLVVSWRIAGRYEMGPYDRGGFRQPLLPKPSQRASRLESELGFLCPWEWNVTSGTILWSNQSWELFGLESDSEPLTFEQFQTKIHPEDLDQVLAAYDLSLRTGAPYSCEFRIQRPGESDLWVWGLGKVFVNAQAQPVRMVGIHADITARKKAESTLREKHSLMEAPLVHSPAAVHSFRLTADGQLSFPYASPRILEIYGIPAEQLAIDASPIANLWHPEDRQRILSSIAESKRMLTPWCAEFRVCRPGRPVVWVEGLSVPVADLDGSVTWHGTLTDITWRKPGRLGLGSQSSH